MGSNLWIDGYDYAVGLLRGGDDPWEQPDGIGTFCSEVLKLLTADYFFLPVVPLFKKHMAALSDAAEDIAEALNEAVEEGGLLSDLEVAIASLSASGVLSSVLLVFPGPATFVALHTDEDAMDLASLALCDVLRKAGSASVPQVALDERHSEGLEMASSMFRIAEHFGISVVLLNQSEASPPMKAFPPAGQGIVSGCCQTIDNDMFTAIQEPSLSSEDVRVMIPAICNPEFVLARIKDLKKGGANA